MATTFIELRIHGVSGTPARELLQTHPVPADDDPATDLTRAPETRPWTRAHRWASLTSGSPRSALWILLLPYMLINVAGWALPPRTSETRHRLDVAGIRLLGVGATAIFALVSAFGFVVIGGVETIGRAFDAALGAGLGALVTLLSVGFVWSLTRARNMDLEEVIDDAGVPDDWPVMRALHLATGAGAALWTLGEAVRVAFPGDQLLLDPGTTVWLGRSILILTTVLAAASPFLRARRWPAVGLLGTSILATVVAALDVWLTTAEPAIANVAGAADDPIAATVVVFAVAALSVVVMSWSRSEPGAAPAIASLVAISGASGAAVGASLLLITASIAGTPPPPALDLIAEGFVVGFLLLAILVLALFLAAQARVPPGPDRGWRAVVEIVDHPLPLVSGIPTIIALVSALVFWAIAAADDTMLFEVAARFAGLVVVALVAWMLRDRVAVALTVIGLAAAIHLLPGALGWEFRQVAVVGTLVIPALLMGTRVVGALRDADERRALAVPWDVGSYFPAIFHPFAPPPYGTTAVHGLRDQLAALTSDGTRVVVSAHSQGSVIAAHALVGNQLPVSLLTIGSPLGTLYRRFFPAHFDQALVTRIAEDVAIWSNLWRVTDPVGGPIDEVVDLGELDDPASRIHGGYWYRDERTYHATVLRHLEALGVDDTSIPPLLRRDAR